jgi:hypothetical protein
VFDVRVTGERGFAETYLLTERTMAGSTTTRLTDDVDPTRRGQPVTFTAIVARATHAEGAPTGSVQFTVDGEAAGPSVALDERGRAEWRTSKLASGAHKITATYVPSAGSELSTSTSVVELHLVTPSVSEWQWFRESLLGRPPRG